MNVTHHMSIHIYSRTPLMMQAPCFFKQLFTKKRTLSKQMMMIIIITITTITIHNLICLRTQYAIVFYLHLCLTKNSGTQGGSIFLHSTANDQPLPDYSGIFWIFLFPWQNNRAKEQNLQLGSTQTYHWQDSTQA